MNRKKNCPRGCHESSTPTFAFYRSTIANYDSFEQWEQEGSLDVAHRANLKWKEILASYEAPALDQSIDEALLRFIAEKKAATPDSSY